MLLVASYMCIFVSCGTSSLSTFREAAEKSPFANGLLLSPGDFFFLGTWTVVGCSFFVITRECEAGFVMDDTSFPRLFSSYSNTFLR